MGPSTLIRLTLLIGFIALCTSKKLSSKHINYFKKNVEEWGAPAISEVISGDYKKQGNIKTHNITYETDGDQLCTARYTTRKNEKWSHEWSCATKKPSSESGSESDELSKTKKASDESDFD